MVPISAFGLGTWQVGRKQWKENLIKELKTKTTFPAVDFPEKSEPLHYCFKKEYLILIFKLLQRR